MTTAKQVYERQAALDDAREIESEVIEQVAAEADYRVRGDIEWLLNHPDVKAAREYRERVEAAVTALQAEIGGKVYRVLNDKLETLGEKVAKLNRRAARLGAEPIEMRETDEREPGEQTIGHNAFHEPIVYRFEWVYIVLRGATPKLNGWMFIAALDHTDVEIDGRYATLVNRIPSSTFATRYMPGMTEAQAAEKLAAIDLNAYRFAANHCDHCNSVRDRRKTFIVANEQGETKQVGSTCIKDFLGGADPHAMARFAELLWAFNDEVEEGSDPSEPSFGSGPASQPLRTFIACAAALTREVGFSGRSDGYGGRNYESTADVAWSALNSKDGKVFVPGMRETVAIGSLLADRDWDDADAAIKWVREEIAVKGADMSDFEHNLVVACTPDWVDARGIGFAAYLPTALRREVERKLAAEAKAKAVAESDYVGEVGARARFTLKVLGVRTIEGTYGVTFITKMVDAEGNRFLWFASRELEADKTYTMTATIKNHEEDRYEGGARTTKIANCRNVEEVDDLPESAEVEVVASAEERALAKEARDARTAARRIAAMNDTLDGLIASYNDVSYSLNMGWYENGDERRELEQSRSSLASRVTAVKERIAELEAVA